MRIIIYSIDKIVHTNKFYLQNYPNIFSYPSLSLSSNPTPPPLSLSVDQALIDQDKDFAGGGSADEYNDDNDFSRALTDEDD